MFPGRIIRDIERKAGSPTEQMSKALPTSKRCPRAGARGQERSLQGARAEGGVYLQRQS
jgi:hypothetical protein